MKAFLRACAWILVPVAVCSCGEEGPDQGPVGGTAGALAAAAGLGAACGQAGNCASGFCVDGVCCDTACGGGAASDCMACSTVAGAAKNGTCGAAKRGTSCRPAADLCDVAETCNGASTACPADGVKTAGTSCRAARKGAACDLADTCDGVVATCADRFKAAGTVCRTASTGGCDVAEACIGNGPDCPPDAVLPAGATCRSSAGPCDPAETCNGTAKTCPTNALLPAGTACRAASGPCDKVEACTGRAAACPSDAYLPKGTACRPAAGTCDVAENCTGTSAACPADAFKANGTACSDANACTRNDTCAAGTCTGVPVACVPPDACHAAACDGATGACVYPVLADGTACDDGNACTRSDACRSGACTGTDPVPCPATDPCRVAGTCDPATGACWNPPAPDGTPCAGSDRCFQAFACVSGTCAGAQPVACPAPDPCHLAGTCDPSTGACLAVAVPDGTACDDGTACTRADSCQAGRCVGSEPVRCVATDRCHLDGECDPASGLCSNPPVPDWTSCTLGPADLIVLAVATPAAVCEGEDVLVTVTTQPPAGSTEDVQVVIDGKPGAARYFQFYGAPGTRPIHVAASTPSTWNDERDLLVEVVDCGAIPRPRLYTRPDPFRERTVDFEVRMPDLVDGTWCEPGSQNYPACLDQQAVFAWDFGDGTGDVTTDPFVSHRYPVLRDEPYTVHQAAVTVTQGVQQVVVHKTLPHWSMYAVNKQRGLIQPPVAAPLPLAPTNDGMAATLQVTNLEDEPVAFDTRVLEFQFGDGQTPTVTGDPEPMSLAVQGTGTAAYRFALSSAEVPAGATGVVARFQGMTPSGRMVSSRVFYPLDDVRKSTLAEADPGILATLDRIARLRLVPDVLRIRESDLFALARTGTLAKTGAIPPSPVVFHTRRAVDPVPFLPQWCGSVSCSDKYIGTECLPGDTPPRAGLTCQATREFKFLPPRIANALKGDIVLVPDCGPIGQLLQHFGQKFSHTGIMVSDHFKIANSTASPARLQDHLASAWPLPEGSAGIDPFHLRYQWPGTGCCKRWCAEDGPNVMSVEEAFNGVDKADDYGNTYFLDPFSPSPVDCSADSGLVYPVVVSPPPGLPSVLRAEVRNRLGQAADFAKTFPGHYRFFAYTRGSIVDDPAFDGPAVGPWLPGTHATMCSGFVREAVKSVPGVMLTNDRARDSAAGRLWDASTPDGMFLYSEEDRRAGAYFLHDYYERFASEKGGILAELPLPGVAAQIANQVTNCFAWDFCDFNHWQPWKNPGVGRSVSPDDILQWHGPDDGGLYGYNEDLVYREGEWGSVFRWQATAGTGDISGYVFDEAGSPVAGARVGIAGYCDTFSGPDGSYVCSAIPLPVTPDATYLVTARAWAPGGYEVDAVHYYAPPTTEAHLYLLPSVQRELLIGGVAIIRNGHWYKDSIFWWDVHQSVRLNSSPIGLSKTLAFSNCVEDEVRLRVDVTLTLDPGTQEVTATTRAGIINADHCPDDPSLESGAQDAGPTIVPPTPESAVTLETQEFDFKAGDDRVKLGIWFQNQQGR